MSRATHAVCLAACPHVCNRFVPPGVFHDRSYRKALSWEVAIADLAWCAGTQFDPAVVEAFLALLSRRTKTSRRLQGQSTKSLSLQR
jgi:HD-GYP domain-containing protein (c-di-GMP phosphodiesterase class II)